MRFTANYWVWSMGLFFVSLCYGQQVQVVDAVTGLPIEDVRVYTDTQQSLTDQNGFFSLDGMKKSTKAYISHIGYESITLSINELLKRNRIRLYPDTQQLHEIVLSVARSKDERKRVSKQVAIIGQQNIQELSPNTSADVLNAASGVHIQKSQGGGGSPVIRGLEANRILLVVDGVRMNNAIYRSGHLQNAITIDPQTLERAEVIYGPSSVGYGSDALGGVVHYYTKTPKIGTENPWSFGLSSGYDTRHLHTVNHIDITHSSSQWASLSSISFTKFGDLYLGKKRNHGYRDWGLVPTYSKNSRTRFYETESLNADPNLQRNTAYNQLDLLQKFVFQTENDNQWMLNMQYSTSSDIPRFDKLSESRDGNLRYAEWYYGPQKRLLISPRYTFSTSSKWLREGTVTWAYQNLEESRVKRKFGNLDRESQIEKLDVYSLNADFSAHTNPGKKIAYGFEFTHNRVRSNAYSQTLEVVENSIRGLGSKTPIPTRYPSDGSTYTTIAAYGDYRVDLTEKSTLDAGLRFTHTRLKADWKDQALIDARLDMAQNQNNALNASLGYVFRPSSQWEWRAVVASGFRAPNIDDIGKIRENHGRISVPNPDLKPEYAYTADLGITRFFENRKAYIQLNSYYTLLHNFIGRDDYFVPSDVSTNSDETILFMDDEVITQANVNLGTANLRGASMGWSLKPLKKWRYSGSVSYTYGQIHRDNMPMPSILPYFGNHQLVLNHQDLKVSVSHHFSSRKNPHDYSWGGEDGLEETPLINPEATELVDRFAGSPAWSRFDMSAHYKPDPSMTLSAHLYNIFDIHYKEFASGISAPGRSLMLRIDYAF